MPASGLDKALLGMKERSGTKLASVVHVFRHKRQANFLPGGSIWLSIVFSIFYARLPTGRQNPNPVNYAAARRGVSS
jgi:hypothetical protein